VQRVEQAVALLDGYVEDLPVGLGVDLGVVATDLEADGTQVVGDVAAGRRSQLQDG